MQLIIGFRLTLEPDVHLQDTKLLYFKKIPTLKRLISQLWPLSNANTQFCSREIFVNKKF
jgi:hypothetical protein